MTIETGEVPDEVLDALLEAAPETAAHPWKKSGLREDWRQAVAAALNAWDACRPGSALTYVRSHECAWRAVGVQHRDALLGIKQTDVLQRCDGCGEVRTPTLTGTWTLEQLRA
jgi:hypothetical protein